MVRRVGNVAYDPGVAKDPSQEEEGVSLRKPLVFALSVIAAVVAYKNVSKKNQKPIAAVIIGVGASYSCGLWNLLTKVASFLETEEEEEGEPSPEDRQPLSGSGNPYFSPNVSPFKGRPPP